MRRPQRYNQPYFFGRWSQEKALDRNVGAASIAQGNERRDDIIDDTRMTPMTIATIMIVAAVAANLDAKDATIKSEKRRLRGDGQMREAPQKQRALSNDVKKSVSTTQRALTQGKGRLQRLQVTAAQGRTAMIRAATTTKKWSRVAKKKARTTTSMTISPWRWLRPPKRQRRPVTSFLKSCVRSSSPTTTLMLFLPRR
jgi:hypothetical protein